MQAAEQVLVEGTDSEECANMMRFAEQLGGAAPGHLNKEAFRGLVSHLYG